MNKGILATKCWHVSWGKTVPLPRFRAGVRGRAHLGGLRAASPYFI